MNVRAEHLSLPPRAPSRTRPLDIGVIGPGKVGQALLDQMQLAHTRLIEVAGIDLRVRLVSGRQRMWLDTDDALLNGRRDGAQTWRPADLGQAAYHLRDARHAVLIDCTASDRVADHYVAWLAAGIHVVTPNKRLGSGPLPRWRTAHAAAMAGQARLRCETTVGAGLPLVQTLRDLIDTGDTLIGVEGIFSGTLAWLFYHYDGSRPFSTLLEEARALGYTEPDPRDDLSGMDVARKLVILAREAGHMLELSDVEVQSLVPGALANADLDTFMAQPQALDASIADTFTRAQADHCVLRYVGQLHADGRAKVGLTLLPCTHPFAHARLTDNIVQFRTHRYDDTPLVVQGPGAGPAVTAGGVFADVLRIADGLPLA